MAATQRTAPKTKTVAAASKRTGKPPASVVTRKRAAVEAYAKAAKPSLADVVKDKLSNPKLRLTEIPGVYINADGVKCDAEGVALSLRRAQELEVDRDEDVLGEPATTPAMVLKRIALDPTLPLHTRMSAAVSAAPYFDRRMPIALEGGETEHPIRTESVVVLRKLNALDPRERKLALSLMEKLGILGDGVGGAT